MIKNYLKIAYRNLHRQKGYTAINVVGLAVGLACAFLIALWIQDEVRYDRFHESADQLYRVMRHVHSGDQIQTRDLVTWPLARVLETYPNVENVGATKPQDFVLRRGDLSARENGLFADPDFFEMFSWHLIQGEPGALLQDPSSIVLSVSLARKHFGSDWRERAVGSTIQNNVGLPDFTVTGVFEDVPRASSVQFDFALPMDLFMRYNAKQAEDWMNSNFHLYVRLRKGAEQADGAALSEKIVDLQNDHIEGFQSDLFLQPYADQHLYSTFENGALVGGRIAYVRMFVLVAFMVVLIACINFMNLATARSAHRAKEIGVRKAVGAGRRSLVGQFMGESFLLVLIAFALGVVLAQAALPVFNDLTGQAVAPADLDGGMLLLFAGIGLLTALIAGVYPAFYLSSFSAVKVLRGTFRLSGGSIRLRRGLVVFQFAMTTLLIVGTVTVYQQIRYIHAKELGLDRENVVSLPLEGGLREQFGAVKEELLRQSGIAAVTSTSESPLDVGSNTHSVSWQGKDPEREVSFRILSAGFDFLDVMNVELAAGRDFDPHFRADSVQYLINERARAVIGLENPLGKRLGFWDGSGPVVGVVKDFHMASLYSEIEPTIIRLAPQQTDMLFVRTALGHTRGALASLEAVHDRFNPGSPFAYEFLDANYAAMYRSETVVGKLAGSFTVVALFIACLGLFGLAAFTAQQRTKEIGIRKALGASAGSIVALLSKDFLLLVGIAFVIAAPVAYFVMQRWLEGFAYRTEIGPDLFLATGLLVLLIAVLTVSYQALRAATANPTDALRSE